MPGKTCVAKTKTGGDCQAFAIEGSDYCFAHDPARAEARAEARKLGGLNRTTHHGAEYSGPKVIRTLQDVLSLLDHVLAESLMLENSIARGRLLVALAGEYTNAIKTGELETRIAALENLRKHD